MKQLPAHLAHRSRIGAMMIALAIGSHCNKSEPNATSAPSGDQPRATACGDKGLPDCPTQAWMKGNLQPFLLANDRPRLARAFDQLAAVAPPGFDGWSAIARAGAEAARANALDAVKRSCSECHRLHRDRFRRELRPTALL